MRPPQAHSWPAGGAKSSAPLGTIGATAGSDSAEPVPWPRIPAAVALDGRSGWGRDGTEDPRLDREEPGGEDPGEGIIAQPLHLDRGVRHRDRALEVRVVPEQRRDGGREGMQ